MTRLAPQCSLTRNYRVAVFQAGADGLATLPALADYLQETAADHAAQLGLGREDMLARGYAWVLVRLYLAMQRMPGLGEELDVLTWPHRRERLSTRRDFAFYDAQGREAGRASTAWVVLDTKARRLAPIPDLVPAAWSGQPEGLEFPGKAVQRLQEPQWEENILIRRADMDINGHVNNARYLEWGLEALPDEAMAGKRPAAADIAFKAECLRGESLGSRAAVEGDRTLHSLVRPDGSEVARMAVRWAGV